MGTEVKAQVSQISGMLVFNCVISLVSMFILATFRSKPLQTSRMSGTLVLI